MDTRVLIVADENIPLVSEAFASLGDVRTMPGRAIDRAAVADADVLLVRSITPVDGALLHGSRVRFVATATIGTDHVDTAYLAAAGIGFSAAPGANANSVAEYVVAALLTLERLGKLDLARSSIGVVGVGNVGGRVAAYAAALGMQVVCNDPPKARLTGARELVPLDELMGCNVITLHVPLTDAGPDATRNLFDGRRLSRMRRDAVLINTSRGRVVDEPALREALGAGRLGGAVLDVWWGEPDIDVRLLRMATLATPHIAGYSHDGKINGTAMVYAATCRYFGVPTQWNSPECEAMVHRLGPRDDVHEVVQRAYDIQTDDARMRGILHVPDAQRSAGFDAFRRNYPCRLEFRNHRVIGNAEQCDVLRRLRLLGFRTPAD